MPKENGGGGSGDACFLSAYKLCSTVCFFNPCVCNLGENSYLKK